MDILYTNSVDGFCIVSSDGDFTRLASRLRESGMHVIGMGENKTPRSFRAACTVFTDLELLIDQSVDEAKSGSKKGRKKKAENVISQKTIENDIIEIITENDNKGRETGLGEIGSRLQKKYSDFDVRNYGYSSLSTFIDETAAFDVKKRDSSVYVALHSDKDMKKRVKKFAVDTVADAGTKGIELGHLGQKIHDEYPTFNVKEFGYATLSKFIYGIKDLKVESSGDSSLQVYIR